MKIDELIGLFEGTQNIEIVLESTDCEFRHSEKCPKSNCLECESIYQESCDGCEYDIICRDCSLYSEKNTIEQCYVGKASECPIRLAKHQVEKIRADFWKEHVSVKRKKNPVEVDMNRISIFIKD